MSDQTEFKGWARVEVMGHQSHTGYVETQTFGSTVMFRVDQPTIPAFRETLKASQWIGAVCAGAGSEVEHSEIPGLTVLIGSGSIYRIIPYDEETAKATIRKEQRRPLMLVTLVSAAPLQVDWNRNEDDENLG